MGMTMEKYCSACFNTFRAGEQAAALGCGHLLCFRCFGHTNVESTRVCPIEGCCYDLTKPGELREIIIEADIGQDKLVLAGHQPEHAIGAVLSSFTVAQRQQQDYFEKMMSHERQKTKRLRAQCEKKLGDIHTGYKNAKKKYEQERASRQTLEGTLKELREKYNEKAHEASALREKNNMHDQENDALRKQNQELQRSNQQLHRSLKQLCREYNIPTNTIPAISNKPLLPLSKPNNERAGAISNPMHQMSPTNSRVAPEHRQTQMPMQLQYPHHKNAANEKNIYNPNLNYAHGNTNPSSFMRPQIGSFQTPQGQTLMPFNNSKHIGSNTATTFQNPEVGYGIHGSQQRCNTNNQSGSIFKAIDNNRLENSQFIQNKYPNMIDCHQEPSNNMFKVHQYAMTPSRGNKGGAMLMRGTPVSLTGHGPAFSMGNMSPQLASRISLNSR